MQTAFSSAASLLSPRGFCASSPLYSQATILQPLMAGKVEELAARHEGLFPWNPRTATRRTSSGDCTEVAFAPWNDWQHDPDVRQMFRRPEMKSISRALEKIERCYDQDASLCTDICRESISFGSLPALIACLHDIREDPQLRVLSVKNRMLLDEDAEGASWGYRDVNLKLCISTPLTAELGLNWHVCELQLLLHDFARLKSEAGHKLYRECRNLRSE
mmetsp:Transcript_917/g.2188  ORF Transcript_917/g.2188 Transcript_917/m.2188 type:complete len:218 (+) Transcript_917:559-1212(+)